MHEYFVKDPDSEFAETFKADKKSRIELFEWQMRLQYPGGVQMTDAQKRRRSEDRKNFARALEADMRRFVFGKVEEAFYRLRRDGWENPWKK